MPTVDPSSFRSSRFRSAVLDPTNPLPPGFIPSADLLQTVDPYGAFIWLQQLTQPTAPVASVSQLGPIESGVLMVSLDAVKQAMKTVHERYPYTLSKTTNASRFAISVLLELVRTAEDDKTLTSRPRLFIDSDVWFKAYCETGGLSPEQAPISVRESAKIDEHILIDYGVDANIKNVKQGADPTLAAHVYYWWSGTAEKLDYKDNDSNPKLEVRLKQVVSFRLLESPIEPIAGCASIVRVDKMEGIHGRPQDGERYAWLFKRIGMGSVDWSRALNLSGGLQVVRSQVSKWRIPLREIVAIYPDGEISDKGQWSDPKSSLAAKEAGKIKQLFEADFDIDYRDRPPLPDHATTDKLSQRARQRAGLPVTEQASHEPR